MQISMFYVKVGLFVLACHIVPWLLAGLNDMSLFLYDSLPNRYQTEHSIYEDIRTNWKFGDRIATWGFNDDKQNNQMGWFISRCNSAGNQKKVKVLMQINGSNVVRIVHIRKVNNLTRKNASVIGKTKQEMEGIIGPIVADYHYSKVTRRFSPGTRVKLVKSTVNPQFVGMHGFVEKVLPASPNNPTSIEVKMLGNRIIQDEAANFVPITRRTYGWFEPVYWCVSTLLQAIDVALGGVPSFFVSMFVRVFPSSLSLYYSNM